MNNEQTSAVKSLVGLIGTVSTFTLTDFNAIAAICAGTTTAAYMLLCCVQKIIRLRRQFRANKLEK